MILFLNFLYNCGIVKHKRNIYTKILLLCPPLKHTINTKNFLIYVTQNHFINRRNNLVKIFKWCKNVKWTSWFKKKEILVSRCIHPIFMHKWTDIDNFGYFNLILIISDILLIKVISIIFCLISFWDHVCDVSEKIVKYDYKY